MTGHLVGVLDAYRDAHGQPSDSSVARAIGAAPQTVSSWRTRGVRQLPSAALLRRLAAFTGEDYEQVVLRAALLDAGYLENDEAAPSGA